MNLTACCTLRRAGRTLRRVGRTLWRVSHTLRRVGRTLRRVGSAPHGALALQDTHGTSRGPEGPSRWGVLYMKNFYGLELLKNHF